MRFITHNGELTIRLEGFDQLWALKRRILVPRQAISEVDFIPEQPLMKDYWGYWRLGTAMPWVFLAGTYWRKGEKEFWFMRLRQPGLLVITFKEGATEYAKIRVSCSAEIAQDIADWWQAR
jgi:hypothetical protein